ncbi:MAG: zinc metallopeptidase [Acutalibacteraceae bacterium]|nr:zinc metallopeptidase [Acutalibacteraceae bacterium]
MFWFYDYYYLILVVPAIIISLIAQANVKSTYKKMSAVRNKRNMTGAQAAYRVLSACGLADTIKIYGISGNLTDHYDPKANVIRLSEGVYNGTSIASIGIACHEAGHAIQHAHGYAPIKIRNIILPVANFGSSAGVIIAILGYFLGYQPIVNIGIILFSAVVVFQLVTLPVEFNASNRAMKLITDNGLLYEDEMPKARKVLTAAALTYVASLLVSIMSLLRLILRTNRRR